MDDRRKADRKYLTFFTRVVDRKSGQLIGYLADMTTGGAQLIGDRRLDPMSELHLRMDMPEGYPQSHLDLHARVVWSQPDIDPDTYRCGLQLIDVTSNEFSLLGRLMSEFGLLGKR